VLFLTGLLALVSAGHLFAQAPPDRLHIAAPSTTAQSTASAAHLIFDAKRSTEFLTQLQSFLNLPDDTDSYAPLIEAFNEAAAKEGVAGAPSGDLVGLAYDWIERNEWKYFVRLEVDFPALEALFERAPHDPVYRDLASSCLIYGGQGILDFKRNVPDYIDRIHERQEFESAKFEPGNRKQARWVYRIAAQEVDLQLSRYREALAFLESRGLDANKLQQKAEAEQRPELKSILLHYAELLRLEGRGGLPLRIAILLSDVERESPALVMAVLRIGEKNKKAVFDKNTNTFEVDSAAFHFLVEGPD